MHGGIVGTDRLEDNGDVAMGMFDANVGVGQNLDGFKKKDFFDLGHRDGFAFGRNGIKESLGLVKVDAGKAERVLVFLGLAVTEFSVGENDPREKDFVFAIPDQAVILNAAISKSDRRIGTGNGNGGALILRVKQTWKHKQ